MDRPPEDPQPEPSSDEIAGSAQDTSAGDPQPPETDRLTTAPSTADRPCDVPPAEPIEVENIDPTRTLVFHRFHPRTSGPPRPHFAPEADAEITDAEITDIDVADIVVSPDPELITEPESISISTKHRQHARRSDPVRHGVVMLLTVLAMLGTARYILPGIVEEIRYAQHRGQLRAEFEVAGEGLKNVSLDTLSQAYQMVNAAAGPSVVHIDIHRTDHQAVAHHEVPGAPAILISDQGSGVVVDADGYILTNRHVVASSDQISVTLSDGRTVDAVIVGTDELTDLAVLKVNADRLIPIPWGDSERIRVGSPVWAIGSPFGLDRTVTFGILSGKHRVVRAKDRYQDFMQSDVAVNPGNSGGPLVDSRGTLIGINTAIVGDTYQGVSFAIPSGIAKKIYLQLRETGSIERGWLGVSLVEVPDDRLQDQNHRVRGAMIAALADRNSGAARAGLKPGDLVISLDQERVRNVDHLMQLIGNAMAGTAIRLDIVRDGQPMEFDVLLGRRPPPMDLR
ncbi:Periplasmic pH-dependent serine endoprotease DegQ precursor [Stieleria maiorica]|uniref:Periplasmic pH-dependent serine endoprotease DegQ n=1 Tax=Stieleria maiorica TaxID=2795974 RepID=A0A5B9MPP0_9BACT|nr:trypsin-like peptidase domain-containing protein [Stieleria maiorica]QEG02101.1 Periplasmic pH-dependent serine endoprotease DegQ precursor [Stieleria maiorica]